MSGQPSVVQVGGEDAKAVSAVGAEDSADSETSRRYRRHCCGREYFFRDEAGGPQATITPLYRQGRIRGLGGGEIHVNVIGDEEIELAVAVVVNESAAGIPALAASGDAGFFRYFGEGAVAVVVVEAVFAKVADEEIVEAVVVVVADAAALPPAGGATPAASVTSVKVPSRLFLKRREMGS